MLGNIINILGSVINIFSESYTY